MSNIKYQEEGSTKSRLNILHETFEFNTFFIIFILYIRFSILIPQIR